MIFLNESLDQNVHKMFKTEITSVSSTPAPPSVKNVPFKESINLNADSQHMNN